MRNPVVLVALFALGTGRATASDTAGIDRIWLAHASPDNSRVVVCWETVEAAGSVVEFGATESLGQTARNDDPVRLHQIEIAAPTPPGPWHYRVRSGGAASTVIRARGSDESVFRVAIVGDTGYAKADWTVAVLRERPHALLTAGDNVPRLHEGAPVARDDVAAFRRLIDSAPELFRTTPFLPALGNHDRELRPRGPSPPPDPVYDVAATAFRKFFALPGDEWRWTFDLPEFGARFIAADLSHVQDIGTTWQTCHDFREGSEPLEWFRATMAGSRQPFVITLYNERHATMRKLANGAWWGAITNGSAAVTGFGYFAERAMVGGFPCLNTSVSGRGDVYPDPASAFLKSEDNFVLMTFARGGKARMELKDLSGGVLDAFEMVPRAPMRNWACESSTVTDPRRAPAPPPRPDAH